MLIRNGETRNGCVCVFCFLAMYRHSWVTALTSGRLWDLLGIPNSTCNSPAGDLNRGRSKAMVFVGG